MDGRCQQALTNDSSGEYVLGRALHLLFSPCVGTVGAYRRGGGRGLASGGRARLRALPWSPRRDKAVGKQGAPAPRNSGALVHRAWSRLAAGAIVGAP